MPSRTSAGTTTNKFDKETHYETLDQMDELRKTINGTDARIEKAVAPVRENVEQLKRSDNLRASQIVDVNSRIDDLDTTMKTLAEVLKLFTFFISTRFFRFLNFFGKWFIYAPDDRIYANTPQNREFVKNALSDPKTRGLTDGNSEDSFPSKEIVFSRFRYYQDGAAHTMYIFNGDYSDAILGLDAKGITPVPGDKLFTRADGKDYLYLDPDNGWRTCDIYPSDISAE